MRHSYATVILLTLSLLSSACRVTDNEESKSPQNQDLNLSPFERLTGQWGGIYRAVENGVPFGDRVDASLQLDSNGSFLLNLKSPNGASATGDWNELQGRSLILKISGSTISRIGSSGELIETAYELLGSSLRIATANFELKLAKRSENPGGSPGDTLPNPRYLGGFICNSTGGRTTKIAVYNNSIFSLTSRAGSERVFLASGNWTVHEGYHVYLSPSHTTDPLPRGSYFYLTTGPERSDLVLKSLTPGQDKELGSCKHDID